MSDAERMILIQNMILGADHFHDSLSPVIPSQTGITDDSDDDRLSDLS